MSALAAPLILPSWQPAPAAPAQSSQRQQRTRAAEPNRALLPATAVFAAGLGHVTRQKAGAKCRGKLARQAAKRRDPVLKAVDLDDEDSGDVNQEVWKAMGMSVPGKSKPLQHAAGDSLVQAKREAQARVRAVAPWGKDVPQKFILVCMERSAEVNFGSLVDCAFAQFGKRSRAKFGVYKNLQDEQAFDAVFDQVIQTERNFLCVHTMSSPHLQKHLEKRCAAEGVTTFNLQETTLAIMERKFQVRRNADPSKQEASTSAEASLEFASDDLSALLGRPNSKPTIYAVSDDNNGEMTAGVVKEAIDAFPGCGVTSVTSWKDVQTLEVVDHIAREAFATNSLVVFALASPGLSRFMRQQCERLKVLYVDILQPLVICMEAYFDYPPVGVTGGLDLQDVDPALLKSEEIKL